MVRYTGYGSLIERVLSAWGIDSHLTPATYDAIYAKIQDRSPEFSKAQYKQAQITHSVSHYLGHPSLGVCLTLTPSSSRKWCSRMAFARCSACTSIISVTRSRRSRLPVPVRPLPNRDLPAASALPPEAGTVRMKRVPLQDLEAALEQYATIAALMLSAKSALKGLQVFSP